MHVNDVFAEGGWDGPPHGTDVPAEGGWDDRVHGLA